MRWTLGLNVDPAHDSAAHCQDVSRMVGILIASPGNPLSGEARWHEVCKALAQHEPNAQQEQNQRQPEQEKVCHGTHWIAAVTRWEPPGLVWGLLLA